MKYKNHWLSHALLISQLSTCKRGKVGALIIDESNNPISMGFNGPPRGSKGLLCQNDICKRDLMKIQSGTRIEIGCHHAEQNALMNALKKGISVKNCKIFITCSPCLICSKLIHHSGIKEVYYPSSSTYDRGGQEYLEQNKIKVFEI